MAMRAYCGFGHDLPTTLVGAGASIVTTARYQHAGNPSLAIAYNGTDAAYFRLLDMTDGALLGFDNYELPCLAISGYVRFDDPAACEILSVTDWVAGNMAASLRRKADGTLALYGDGGALLETGTTVLAQHTWYHVQLTVNLGATGAYALAIGLVEEFSGTGNFGTDWFSDVRFGVSDATVSDACTFRWANVSVDDAAVPATGQRVIVRNLDSVGTYGEWTTGTWEDVADDPVADGDTTVITTSTSGHRLTGQVDLLTQALPAATPVYGVMCRAVSKSAGAGTVALRCMVRSVATDIQTSPHTIGTSWTQSAKLAAVDPATGVAWLHAGAVDAEVGVRRGSGSTGGVNNIVTAVWMEILVGVSALCDYIIPAQAGVTALAFMSDMHAGGGGSYFEHAITALNWVQMHGVLPKALCNSGDLTESPLEADPYHDWIRDAAKGDLDATIESVVTPGNHDTNQRWVDVEYGAILADPYSALRAIYPTQFGANDYAAWDDPGGIVRVAVINNNSDYLGTTGTYDGHSMYFNCNPPGAQHVVNPDNSGITIPASIQRVWLNQLFDNPAPPWRVVIGHRSMWAPYDTDPRKLNRDARAAMLTPIDKGVSLIVTGDIHVGSLSGPWYPAGGPAGDEDALYVAPGGTGAYSLTHAGGYTVRDVDTDVLPGHSTVPTCIWSSGVEDSQRVQVSLVLFSNTGDTAQIVIFEASEADPLGAVVYNGTLTRNTAGDPLPEAPMTYLDPDMVRSLCHLLTVDIITDDELETIAESFADPEIDTALSGFGAPFGYTSPPQIIRVISALLTTAIAFDDRFCQTADESRFAAAKRKDARSLIQRIQKGELSLGLVDDDPLIDVSDSDLETRPAEEVFAGDELDWAVPTNTRES